MRERLRLLRVIRAAPAVALALMLSGIAWPQSVQNPRRLADGLPGQLLVTDRHFGAIVAVDERTLEPIWSFTLPNEGAPFGLATWNRLVYVGNTKTRNVEVYRIVFTPTGDPSLRFEYNLGGTPPGEIGSIGNPVSIAIDSRERLAFVLDGAVRGIEIFDWQGARVGGFEPADETGSLLSPVSVAVDETRCELLVSDYGDPSGSFSSRSPARILIFDYEGTLLTRITGDGSTHATTNFVRVQGVATTTDGRIFAAEPLAGQILVLARETGELLETLGITGDAPGELRLPLDVLLDGRTGDLFVSNNRGARRVETFRGVAPRRRFPGGRPAKLDPRAMGGRP